MVGGCVCLACLAAVQRMPGRPGCSRRCPKGWAAKVLEPLRQLALITPGDEGVAPCASLLRLGARVAHAHVVPLAGSVRCSAGYVSSAACFGSNVRVRVRACSWHSLSGGPGTRR